MIRIGLVQMASSLNAEENLEALIRLAGQAAQEGCAAVCFPEAALTGYAPERAASLSLERGDPLLDRLSACAKEKGLDILAGYMEKSGGACHLTHGVFRPDGTRHAYRKTHLGEREAQFFTPGESLDVFPLSCGLHAGFQLCVELHFPEITQTLSLKGAQIVFAPHAAPGTPEKRRALWQTYVPARAYDNRVYVACCNQADGARFGGGCYAVNPKGEVVADCFSPGLSVFEVDRQLPARYRAPGGDIRSRYYPKLRRPHLYV